VNNATRLAIVVQVFFQQIAFLAIQKVIGSWLQISHRHYRHELVNAFPDTFLIIHLQFNTPKITTLVSLAITLVGNVMELEKINAQNVMTKRIIG